MTLFNMLCASGAIWTDQTLAFAGDDGSPLHYLFGLWWESPLQLQKGEK